LPWRSRRICKRAGEHGTAAGWRCRFCDNRAPARACCRGLSAPLAGPRKRDISEKPYRGDPAIGADGDIPLSEADELEIRPGGARRHQGHRVGAASATVIRRAPTGPECDSIVIAVEEYVYLSDFKPATNNV
jgi:hypothetical protein